MKKTIDTKFLKNLEFRRQFLLGPEKYVHNKYWHCQKLKHQLFLSIHKDLSFFSKEKNEFKITLIGLAIDCTKPTKTANKIVDTLLDCFNDIYSVIKASKPLAGRWVLICQDANNTFIFTDPCGLRQVYFSTGSNFWCASQPTLIKQVEELSITSNKSILKLRDSTEYKKKESSWLGNKTIFDNCLHLMPNHYLDFNKRSQIRFFPLQPLSTTNDVDNLVPEVATYLKNIMDGLDQRFNLRMGLSGGFDSRLLLAASKDITNNISFKTDNLGTLNKYHGDIYVPKNLARRFKLNHEVLDIHEMPPAWFIKMLAKNVLDARVSPVLPKIKSIYAKLLNLRPSSILINGNVTEVVRIREEALKYEQSINDNSSNNLDPLVKLFGYDNDFATNEIIAWLNSIDLSLLHEATPIEIFYWEQRMSNWGALYPAETDISAESISPFNCRLLLETCLKVPRKQRLSPECSFFRKVITKNWPEILLEPINPGPKGLGLFKKTLRETLPPMMVKYLRKFVI